MANKQLIIDADMSVEHKVMGLLACIAQEKKSEMERLLKPSGLSILQLSILHSLSFAPKKTLTVSDLKATLVDDNPNVSRTLNKLVEAGLVIKLRSEQDQRTVYVSITDAGEKAHTDADQLLLNQRIDLPENEMNALYEILKKL
ncbi:MarR family winged helix-turn-helix transcriptional regulator [Kordiimonas laminariae]|uniref:MarR family winged helix-turn-helix transcriptional regulator n=1 Tax=Kordiimonas laminariae TaxID=2917717 RepID=UPI001FF537DD|nr:MarR family transcriptional regulator [Kordiimonas laminariae]MCK0069161.1 MarR family transcriptional regulator [Kordiimonas laminariae]